MFVEMGLLLYFIKQLAGNGFHMVNHNGMNNYGLKYRKMSCFMNLSVSFRPLLI